MSNKNNLVVGGLVFLGLATLIFGLFWPLGQDEGVFLTIANGFRNGAIPYRDIFDHKPPGIYFFLFLLMQMKIKTVIGLRIVNLTINLAMAVIIYLGGKRFWTAEAGLWSGVLFLLMLPTYEGNLILTETLMSFFIVIGLFSFLIGLRNRKMGLFFISGLAIGLATIFKQPALINFMILAILLVIKVEGKKNKINNLIVYTSGFCLIWIPVILFFQAKNSLPQFWTQVFWLNITSYPASGSQLIIRDWLSTTSWTLPIWVLAAYTAVIIIRRLGRTPVKENMAELTVLISLLTILPVLFYRYYPHYWLQVIPLVAVLAGLGIVKIRNQWGEKFYNLVIIGVGVVALAAGGNFMVKTVKIELPLRQEQFRASSEIRQRTNPTDSIYAYRTGSWVYYLADRRPASGYLYINEVFAPENGTAKLKDDLLKKQPKYILWTTPSVSGADSNINEVNKIIRDNYQTIKSYPRLEMTLMTTNRRPPPSY